MPDSYFLDEKINNDLEFSPRSALTAVIEIMNYNHYLESANYFELQTFYFNLAEEIHKAIRDNYRRGFNVIIPEFRIISNRIYIYTLLYLEKDVPELNSMIFNLFVETCNMLMAVSLRDNMVIRGIAGIDKLFKSKISSNSSSWLEKKDTLILSDMLKVFSFDEIFPEGLEKVFIPPASLRILHSENFLKAEVLLSDINTVGIYFPANIQDYAFSELAVYSDMLLEISVAKKKFFTANWINYANKYPDTFNIDELKKRLSVLAEDKIIPS